MCVCLSVCLSMCVCVCMPVICMYACVFVGACARVEGQINECSDDGKV